jgi:hypothetical protein
MPGLESPLELKAVKKTLPAVLEVMAGSSVSRGAKLAQFGLGAWQAAGGGTGEGCTG